MAGDILNSALYGDFGKALKVHSQRLDVLANNLANADTPGFKARDIEVLLLSDPVDAFWVRTALGFESKPFNSITQGSADLDNIPIVGDERKVSQPARESDVATLAALVKEALKDKVSDVRSSSRLATSPACLVAADAGYDKLMEKIVSRHGQSGFGGKPVLEINPSHGLVKTLAKRAVSGSAAAEIEDAAWLLLGSAEILDGEAPSDPVAFNRRLLDVMALRFAAETPSETADAISSDGDHDGGAGDA